MYKKNLRIKLKSWHSNTQTENRTNKAIDNLSCVNVAPVLWTQNLSVMAMLCYGMRTVTH